MKIKATPTPNTSYLDYIVVEVETEARKEGVKYFLHQDKALYTNPTLKMLGFVMRQFRQAANIFIQKRISSQPSNPVKQHVDGSIAIIIHPDQKLELIDLAMESLMEVFPKRTVTSIDHVFISMDWSPRLITVTVEYNKRSRLVYVMTLARGALQAYHQSFLDEHKLFMHQAAASAVHFFMFRNNFVISMNK